MYNAIFKRDIPPRTAVGIAQATRDRIHLRCLALALQNGRDSTQITQDDYEQAKLAIALETSSGVRPITPLTTPLTNMGTH